jgi:hypothetical protein
VAPSILKKLAITSLTGGSRSVDIVRSRTQTIEFSFSLNILDISGLNKDVERKGHMEKRDRQSRTETGKQKDQLKCSYLNFQPGFGASTHRSDASPEYSNSRYNTPPARTTFVKRLLAFGSRILDLLKEENKIMQFRG